ncbi:MAG: RNA polymerase sigma factor [Candidatus Moranbacteria bacterium]|nr:RNA polymerase sigma factor [Candidatus Moranbacteria bacterium]
MIEDNELIEDFLGGDEKAFELIVHRYLKPLYNFAFQLTGDRVVSEDIIQDVFFKVWKNLSKFNSKKKFSTWIFTITKNTAFDWLKKKKNIPFSFLENENGENTFEKSTNSILLDIYQNEKNVELENILEKMMSQLPEISRGILLLHHIEGFTLVEIAEIFDQPANTVKSKYRRALLFLRGNIIKGQFDDKTKIKVVAPKIDLVS